MNKKKVENLIPLAITAIKDVNDISEVKILDGSGGLYSNYSGYIDSFGPTIRQSGLMQTVVFNEKNEKRKLINGLLFEILKKGEGEILNTFVANTVQINDLVKLVESVSGDNLRKKKLENLILEAVVACKFAIKTFKKVIVEDNE